MLKRQAQQSNKALSKLPISLLAISFLFIACDLFKKNQTIDPDQQKLASEAALANNITSILTPGEKNKLYSSYVSEMMAQIFMSAPGTQTEVDSWVNIMMQGGSLEGIYHGLVLSQRYRILEQKTGVASIQALRFFSEEMAHLEPNKESAKTLAQKWSRFSVFTLKKELAEKYLDVLDEKKSNSDALTSWYAKTVVRLNTAGINFGFPQRNSKDEAFHKQWAKNSSFGVIQWELLNRIHRLMNYYSGMVSGN